MGAIEPIDELAEITPQWMQSALSAAGFDVTVTAVEAEPIGTGQMSLNFRARVEATGSDSDLPGTFVLKVPSPNRDIRPLVKAGYRSEIAFYRDLLPTVAVKAPRCFLSMANEDATSFTLLLEDLAPAAQGDQIAGATLPVIESAVHNLAALHGPRWCDPSLRDYAWVQPSDADAHRYTADLVKGAIPGLAERLGEKLSSDDLRTLCESADVLSKFLAHDPRFGPVHGDYRLDNLMISPTGAVSAIDWQTLTVGLPTRDLSYLLATSVTPALRKEAERGVVESYCEHLAELGVDGYSARQCFDDYRLAMLHGVIIIVLGAAYGTPTERGDLMFAAMIARSCAAIRELDTVALASAL
jgi:aminoglycoside/choline kinase family phosphotransferase